MSLASQTTPQNSESPAEEKSPGRAISFQPETSVSRFSHSSASPASSPLKRASHLLTASAESFAVRAFLAASAYFFASAIFSGNSLRASALIHVSTGVPPHAVLTRPTGTPYFLCISFAKNQPAPVNSCRVSLEGEIQRPPVNSSRGAEKSYS